MAKQPVKLDPSSDDLKKLGKEMKEAATALSAANKAFGAGVTKKSAGALKTALDGITKSLASLRKSMADLEESLKDYRKAFSSQQKDEKETDQKVKEIEGLRDAEAVLNSDYADQFRDFCKKEHSSENVEFIDAIKNRATPISIYKDFVANEKINIPASEQKVLVAKYGPIVDGTPSRDRPNLSDFDDAKKTILKLLTSDTVNRFKKDLVEEVEKQAGRA